MLPQTNYDSMSSMHCGQFLVGITEVVKVIPNCHHRTVLQNIILYEHARQRT